MGHGENHKSSPPAAEGLRLRVLGRVEVTRDGEPIEELIRRRKPLALLAYIALDRSERFFQRDHLCGVFWPETSQARARASLRQALSTIRRALPDVFEHRGDEEVRAVPGRLSSDLDDFLLAAKEGRWTDAAELDGGDAFDGFHVASADRFEDWISSVHLTQKRARADVASGLEATATVPGVGGTPVRGQEGAPLGVGGESESVQSHPSTSAPLARIRATFGLSRWVRLALAPAAVIALALFAAIAARGSSSITPPSIVVTTPANLGPDEDGLYLARGIHEEVVAQLSRIDRFSLVPTGAVRSSEAEGLSGQTLALGLEAQFELGSSVLMEDGRARVVFTLTDWTASDIGELVWTRAFVAEGGLLELTTQVVAQMATAFMAGGRSVGLTHSGATPGAMPHYYTAVGLMGIEGSEGERFQRWLRADEHLKEALDSAPNFAAGWAKLAHLRFRAFWLGLDSSAEGIAEGEAALARAVSLDESAIEVRLTQAYHAYHVTRDWDRASSLASVLTSELDTDPDVALVWAMAERRRGNFQEAADIMNARLMRYPQEVGVYGGELLSTYTRLGRAEDMDRMLHWLEDTRGGPLCGHRYNVARDQRGDAAELDVMVEWCESQDAFPSHGPRVFWHELRMKRTDSALEAVDAFEARRRVAEAERPDWLNQQWAPFPLDLWRGIAYQRAGQEAEAQVAFEAPLEELETLVAEFPGLALRRQFLATAYAGVGRSEEALAQAEAALEIALEGGDRWFDIPNAYYWLARTNAEVGEVDRALDIIETHLATDPWFSVGRFRLEPALEAVRASARSGALIARMESASSGTRAAGG